MSELLKLLELTFLGDRTEFGSYAFLLKANIVAKLAPLGNCSPTSIRLVISVHTTLSGYLIIELVCPMLMLELMVQM